MAFFTYRDVEIAGIAAAVPQNVKTAEDFSEVFGAKAVQRFSEKTGIRAVHITSAEQTAGDLGYEAAAWLLRQSDIDKSQIGTLLFVSHSPDYRRPATACVLQKRLELSMDCAAMDVSLGCSGFVYGLQTAANLLENSDKAYALLVLAETGSKLVAPQDKSIAMMFGDAGAAVLLKKQPGIEAHTLLRTDGNRFKTIILPGGGFRDLYPSPETFMCSDGIERSMRDLFMDGASVFSFAISDVLKAIQEFLDKTGTGPDDYDFLALHQANGMILRQIARKLRIGNEKVPFALERYGNTSSTSIPLSLCDRLGDEGGRRVRILAAGFGVGLSWGVTSFALDTDAVFPVIETNHFYAEGKILPGML